MSELSPFVANSNLGSSSKRDIGVRITQENPIAVNAAADLAAYLEASKKYSRLEALPHQQGILEDVLDGLYSGELRGNVESPTATGKTYIMCRLAEAFYTAGKRVLILADRQLQADQILGKVGNTGLIQTTDAMDLREIGTHYGDQKSNPEDRVVVSTYKSLLNFAKKNELGQFDVILADEAHKSLGTITKDTLINYCPKAIKIGFTATPSYSVDKNVTEIFDYPYHQTSIKEAIENNLVAPVTSLVYATHAEIPYLDFGEEYSQTELDALIRLKPRNDAAIQFAKDFIADGRQGTIGCIAGDNMAHARFMAKELDGDIVHLADGTLKFIRAKAVGGFQSPAQNRQILQEFEDGRIDVITFVDLITEGWNSDVNSFLIDMQPTTSLVRKIQKVGRVLRKKANNLQSIVVDFIDYSRKNQVTALDVLGERRVSLGRVYAAQASGSSETNNETSQKNRSYLQKLLSSNLWYELQDTDHHLLSSLRVRNKPNNSAQDPVFAEYDQKLQNQYQIGQEPENSMQIPDYVTRKLGAFVRQYARLNRILPTIQEIEVYINNQLPNQADTATRLAQLALQGFDFEPSGLIQLDPNIPKTITFDEIISERQNKEIIRKCIGALPERERLILELKFGFYDEEEWPLERISHHPDVEVTRERVRQLIGQALSRLSYLREMGQLADDSNQAYRAPTHHEKLLQKLHQQASSAEQVARTYANPQNNWEKWKKEEAQYTIAIKSITANLMNATNTKPGLVPDEEFVRRMIYQKLSDYDLPERLAIIQKFANTRVYYADILDNLDDVSELLDRRILDALSELTR